MTLTFQIQKSVFISMLLLGSLFANEKIIAPFLNGEELDYEISWGFITAGTAKLSVLPGRTNGEIEFRSTARNNGFFETVYPVLDTVSTYVDKNTLLPRLFSKRINEGGWHNHTRIDFEKKERQAFLSDTVFNGSSKNQKIKRHSDTLVVLDGATHSVTSAFYLIRTMKLIPGMNHEFLAVSGKKKYNLKVIVHGYESIKTDAGTFNCIKVEPVLAGDGIFKAKGKMLIWLSLDARRIPVRVKTKVALGSVNVDLTKIR